ncbi:hemerythrin domain-containing protein [Sphingosinicella humi]|uniref:Hemerythrin n=1 Tax=Allosphingosinicella humi TaxID=2068657 RepID=A0A2U2IZ25_9SPHN|nr:hemerythrin domain-containing protein [Sphingosinicella humi]PWG01291.1 hemerythrin [Sphingosinicella humi]
MATKTRARPTGESKPHKSAFNWGNGNTGVLVGAAVAGAAVGLAANAGRKLFMQFGNVTAGDWFEALKMEHEMALAIFDKIEGTDDSQTTMRSHLLSKLKYALSKHAIQEEMVIYPALRQAGHGGQADHLNSDHGMVKAYLYELETMPNDSSAWMAKVREFRTEIEEHMREEEQTIFPPFRSQLSDEENSKLTAMMNKEGFKHA